MVLTLAKGFLLISLTKNIETNPKKMCKSAKIYEVYCKLIVH